MRLQNYRSVVSMHDNRRVTLKILRNSAFLTYYRLTGSYTPRDEDSIYAMFRIRSMAGDWSVSGLDFPRQPVPLGKYGFWITLTIIYIAMFTTALIEHKI
jgi:hypothetical protein